MRHRLARWLLTVQDRVHQDSFTLTQQLLAGITLVSRQRLNRVATGLREAGLIDYRRGSLTIIDRAGLEAGACECYGVVRREFDRVYAPAPGSDAPAG